MVHRYNTDQFSRPWAVLTLDNNTVFFLYSLAEKCFPPIPFTLSNTGNNECMIIAFRTLSEISVWIVAQSEQLLLNENPDYLREIHLRNFDLILNSIFYFILLQSDIIDKVFQ